MAAKEGARGVTGTAVAVVAASLCLERFNTPDLPTECRRYSSRLWQWHSCKRTSSTTIAEKRNRHSLLRSLHSLGVLERRIALTRPVDKVPIRKMMIYPGQGGVIIKRASPPPRIFWQ